MKTLIMYNQFNSFISNVPEILFFELEGDYRHLDQVFINSGDNLSKEDELFKLLILEETGEFLHRWKSAPTKDWDFFISCGFIP